MVKHRPDATKQRYVSLDIEDMPDAKGETHTQRLDRKITWQLLPIFFAMVVFCYIDRTNLAFAAIQLNEDLGFGPQVYGMGSGLFFLGYSTFQIPSNLILRVVGGRVWLAFVVASWAVAATAFSCIKTTTQFYMLRLLLGVTEAGAFPGMWYYLTSFYGDQVTLPFAVVESGIAISHVIAAPLAAACLSLDGWYGLAGWQWLFLIEGIPSLVLAGFMAWKLPHGPHTATWLSAEEKEMVARRVAKHYGSNPSLAALPPLIPIDTSAGHMGSPGHISDLQKAGSSCASTSGTNGGGGSGGGSAAMLPASASASALARSISNSGAGPGSGMGSTGAGASTWQLLCQAAGNKYVWYMGGIKFTRDIASFGIIFWTPTIVNAVLHEAGRAAGNRGADAVASAAVAAAGTGAAHGGHSAAHHGHSGTHGSHAAGLDAVLLTAVPFALAAVVAMLLAHRSQQAGERIYHVSVPYICTGFVFSLFPVALRHSAALAFITLTVGIIGVYSGSAASLAMLNGLAAGPSLVVALPLYNSLGTMGGFVGPVLVGWLVESSGGSFGMATSMMGICLGTAGVMVLGLGAVLRGAGLGVTWAGGSGGSSVQGGRDGVGSPWGGVPSQGTLTSRAAARS